MSSLALTRPQQTAVERYFEVALYLLVLTGFATLAGTGKLDPVSVIVALTGLAYRGYLLARREELVIPEQWTTWLTILYVLFYLADFFFLSRSFVGASVHLVLFSMVVKVFSVHRDRDLLYLAVLSFMEVLAAAVLTVDSLFLISFALFLLLAVATFISYEMRRTARRVTATAREHPEGRRLARALSGTALLMVVAILVAGTVIFFVLPRISVNYLASLGPRSELATGFSPDEVNLNKIGEIQQSSEVVMHVRVEGDTTGAHPGLLWRGVAFANFDGGRWFNPAPLWQKMEVLHSRNGNFILREVTAKDAPLPPLASRITYRVMMEPIGSNVFFFAGQPLAMAGNYRLIGYDRSLAFYNLDRERPVGIYQALGTVQPAVSPATAREAAVPPEVALLYLQMPPRLDRRIPDLARRVTAAAPDGLAKAKLLEDYLRSSFTYTLQLPQQQPPDPIAHFLFERKSGHCEYFASSLALLLRSLEIPARVVNGFRGGEFNPVTGSYIVRARDAHSWVEAYFPGAGWVTFDPTPPSSDPAASGIGRLRLYLDALSEFWREWVVNYDFSHQSQVSNSVVVRARRMFLRWTRLARLKYEQMLERARQAQKRAAAAPEQWSTRGIVLIVALVLLFNSRRIVRMVRATRLARAPGRAPKAAASIWYERMTRSVAKRGYEKSPLQTPREFVVTIEDPHLRRRVEAFTRAYERARFADSPADARQLPELYEEVLRKPGR